MKLLIIAIWAGACSRDGLGVDGADAIMKDGGPSVPDGMVEIPSGPFWMGCNEPRDTECASREYPYHEVTLAEYWVDRTEVTVQAFFSCVEAGGCTEPREDCDRPGTGRDLHPMRCLRWEEASDYCTSVSKVLPTEAQWEKAARGNDGRVYVWGDAAPTCNRVNYANCLGGTEPVASRLGDTSPYGIADMAGNVLEWVGDWYDEDYYQSSPANDPMGPDSGTLHVGRGGSYFPLDVRVSMRAGLSSSPYANAGVRCVWQP